MQRATLRMWVIGLIALLGFIGSGCGDSSSRPEDAAGGAVPPVYVTVAGHIEDVPAYAECGMYSQCRAHLLTFAETLSETAIAFNLQIEYEFFLGLSSCETEQVRATTDGLNVLDYLVTHYGFEIDPHQEGGVEEGQDNYADIRYLAGTLIGSVSDVVGGLVWDDPSQFTRLAQGEPGWVYPDFIWHPRILTLAVSADHHHGDFSRDDVASGVWRPAGANSNFWVDDDDGPLIYVGPGEHSNWGNPSSWFSTADFVAYLVEGLQQNQLDRSQMYTATLAVPQSTIFDPTTYGDLLNLLSQLDRFIQAGQAVYVTYSEAVQIWATEYGSQPNVFRRSASP